MFGSAGTAVNESGALVRVLGVDPGLTRCGIGVVEGTPGSALRVVDVDVIRTTADLGIAVRLELVGGTLQSWVEGYQPDVVAVERVFSQHNVRTVMGTAQVSGVALFTAARCGVPVAVHTPSEVKAAVSGNGRADKRQVAAMVTRLLRLAERPSPPDATDALALAICAIWRGAATGRLEAARLADAHARAGGRFP